MPKETRYQQARRYGGAAYGRARHETVATAAEGGVIRALLFFALSFVIAVTGFWGMFSPWGIILTGAVLLGGLLFSRPWSVLVGYALGFGVYIYLWVANSPILDIFGGIGHLFGH